MHTVYIQQIVTSFIFLTNLFFFFNRNCSLISTQLCDWVTTQTQRQWVFCLYVCLFFALTSYTPLHSSNYSCHSSPETQHIPEGISYGHCSHLSMDNYRRMLNNVAQPFLCIPQGMYSTRQASASLVEVEVSPWFWRKFQVQNDNLAIPLMSKQNILNPINEKTK